MVTKAHGNLCAVQSLAVGESPAGTAPKNTAHWILLQIQKPWAAKAWRDADIPDAVRHHVDSALAEVTGSRLQLIRRPTGEDDGSITVFVGRSTPNQPVLFRFQLDTLDALLQLDLAGLMTTKNEPEARHEDPVFLVCTHGTRDRCCARWGSALYRALGPAMGQHLWHASHVGGHRFAPNLLVLPVGVLYGRLPTDGDALSELIQDLNSNQLPSGAVLRGRTCYNKPTQAAEAFLFEMLQRKTLGGVTLIACEPSGAERWRVQFAVEGHDAPYIIDVERQPLGTTHVHSCGDAVAKPAHSFVHLKGSQP